MKATSKGDSLEFAIQEIIVGNFFFKNNMKGCSQEKTEILQRR
jgi:hypothetical protein